jgi:hypothetical protein
MTAPEPAAARSRRPLILGLFAAALAASILLLPAHGTPDVDQYWLRWIDLIRAHGLREGYRLGASDYPPFAFAILAAASGLGTAAGIGAHAALKLSLWLFLVISTVLFHWIGRRPLLSVAFFASAIVSSVGQGYLDIYFVPTLLASLWALERGRFGLGLLLYGVTCLVKFQPAIIGPALLVYLYRAGRLRFRIVAPSLVLAALVALLFGPALVSALGRAAGHRYLSAQALNFNWLLAFGINVFALQAPVSQVPNMLASPAVLDALRILFLGIYAAVLVRIRPATFGEFLRAATAGYAAYLAFAPAVHENHSMVLVVLLGVAVVSGEAAAWEFLAIAFLANLNLVAFSGLRGAGPAGPPVLWLVVEIAVALAMTTMLIYVIATRMRRSREERVQRAAAT